MENAGFTQNHIFLFISVTLQVEFVLGFRNRDPGSPDLALLTATTDLAILRSLLLRRSAPGL